VFLQCLSESCYLHAVMDEIVKNRKHKMLRCHVGGWIIYARNWSIQQHKWANWREKIWVSAMELTAASVASGAREITLSRHWVVVVLLVWSAVWKIDDVLVVATVLALVDVGTWLDSPGVCSLLQFSATSFTSRIISLIGRRVFKCVFASDAVHIVVLLLVLVFRDDDDCL